MRDSLLDIGKEDQALQGVVLLDLPDHDSTEVSHHLEVDRLIELTDLMVWVLDPQKYADAAVHDRYLAPLASHWSVMLVVLNHVDEVPDDRRQSMLEDIRRLLDADGLERVPLLPISALTGEGVDALRYTIADRVHAKQVTRARLEADLRSAAQQVSDATGSTGLSPELSRERIDALDDSFAEAAGVPTLVEAVEAATRVRVGRATGWPVTSWLSRLRPDPLKRLHLDLGKDAAQYTGRRRASVPATTQIQRARVDAEVRALADEVSAPLSRPWADAVRRASVAQLPHLGDRLDEALMETQLDTERVPAWAGMVRLLQWLLLLVALAGLVWSGVVLLDPQFGVDRSGTPDIGGFPVPVLLLVGGVVLGLLLALVCRFLVAVTARRRARTADRRLRSAIATVAEEMVMTPVRDELAAYDTVREGLAVALR
jgi:hypothetical protein